MIRLPWEVSPFRQWLQVHDRLRAERVMVRIQEMRGGKDSASDFASRMKGSGQWAELVRQRFAKASRRLGCHREHIELDVSRFRPPVLGGQGQLFWVRPPAPRLSRAQ